MNDPTGPPVTRETVEHFVLHWHKWFPLVIQDRLDELSSDDVEFLAERLSFVALHLEGWVKYIPSNFVSGYQLSRHELQLCHDEMVRLEAHEWIECRWYSGNRVRCARLTDAGHQQLEQLEPTEAAP